MVEKSDVVNNGTTDLYEYYDNGWYLDAQLTKNTSKITIPQWKGRTFQGYYTAVSGGTQIIDANGNILAKIIGLLMIILKSMLIGHVINIL